MGTVPSRREPKSAALSPARMCAGSGLRSSPILHESSVFRIRPPASKSRLAERGLQSPTRGRILCARPTAGTGQLGVEILPGPKVLEQQAVLGPGGVVRDASELQERAPRHQCPVGLPRAEAGAVLWRKTRDAVLDLPPAQAAVATGAFRDGSGRQIEWVDLPARRDGGLRFGAWPRKALSLAGCLRSFFRCSSCADRFVFNVLDQAEQVRLVLRNPSCCEGGASLTARRCLPRVALLDRPDIK